MDSSVGYTTADAADLILDHTRELAKIAKTAGLETLGYLLEMAHLEATEFCKAGGLNLEPLICPAALDPDIERALAAMGDVGILETDNDVAKFGQAKPVRHLPAQHADFAAAAFPGDHQHQARVAGAGGKQKAQQHRMRLVLGEAVQIEPGVDRMLALGDSGLHAPRQRLHFRLRRWGDRFGGDRWRERFLHFGGLDEFGRLLAGRPGWFRRDVRQIVSDILRFGTQRLDRLGDRRP